MTDYNSKKFKSVLALFTVLLMAGCSQNSLTAEETSEATTVSTTAKIESINVSEEENTDKTSDMEKVKVDTNKSYTDAKSLIDNYTNNYIRMNSEEKSIYSKEEVVSDYSSEGGTLTKFYDENDNLLRCRLILYGSIGKVEENYYFIDNQHRYYTVLAETYNTFPLTQADLEALSYEFSEYWFDNESIYSIDNVNGALIICDTTPISEPLSESVHNE